MNTQRDSCERGWSGLEKEHIGGSSAQNKVTTTGDALAQQTLALPDAQTRASRETEGKGVVLACFRVVLLQSFQFFVWRKVYLTTHKTIAKTQTSFAFVVLLLLASPFTVLLPVAAAADVVVVVVVGRAVPLGGWHTG